MIDHWLDFTKSIHPEGLPPSGCIWGLILPFSIFISYLQTELVYISALLESTFYSCFGIFVFFRGKIAWQQSKESVMPRKKNLKPMFNHWGHSFYALFNDYFRKGMVEIWLLSLWIVWHRLGNRGLYPRNCFFPYTFDMHSTLSKSLLAVLLFLCFSFFF